MFRPTIHPPGSQGGIASEETQGKNTQGGWQRASGHCLAPNFRPPCNSIKHGSSAVRVIQITMSS